MTASIIKQASKIANQELRACYHQHGILAGRHHFTDYWARDGFFAALGSISIGDYHIVQKMLNLFFKHQRQDGLIPYRIMNGPMISINKYLFGKPPSYSKPKPTYRLRGFGQDIFDGTTLAIIILAELGLKGQKTNQKHITKAYKALKYLEKKERHLLLWDGPMAEWNDTAYKFGNLLYSNILYWQAVKRFTDLIKHLKKKQTIQLRNKQKQIAKAIRRRLWNGKFFSDWHDWKHQNYFYPFANLLAIAWEFTTKKETKLILKQTKLARKTFTFETNIPKYPFWRIDILHHLVNMGSYQNQGILWLQTAFAYIAAQAKIKKVDKAINQLEIISKQIVKYKGIYECYERNGTPVNRLIYKSEHPFAWNTGMFLWVKNITNI